MPGLKDIAKRAGIDDDLAQRFIEAIGATLEEGDTVRIRGLGSFTPVRKSARRFSTPVMKGQETIKPAHVAIKYSPSTVLDRRLNPIKTDQIG